MITKDKDQLTTETVDSKKNKKFVKNSSKLLSLGLASAMGISSAVNAASVTQDNIGLTDTDYGNATDIVTFDNTIAATVLGADAVFASGTTTASKDLVWSLSGGHTLTVTGILDTQTSGDMTINISGTDTELAVVAAWTEHSTNSGDQHHINIGAGAIMSMTTDVTRLEAINGSTAGVGKLTVGGTTTFSEAIGTTALAEISVATTKTATFSELVKATTVSAVGSVTFAKAVTATNINLTGSTMSVINAGAIAVAGAITEVSGTTSLVVKNATATDAPSLTTFAGAVTTDTVVVGAANTSGAAKFSSAVTSAVSVLGGDHDDEDSTVELVSGLTGNLTITTGTNDGIATATLSGGSTAATLTGNVLSGTNNKGALVISGTARTITGTVGAEDKRLLEVSIADGADTTISGVIHAKTLDIDTNATGEVTTLGAAGNVIGGDGETAGALQIAGGELQLDTTILTGTTIFDVKETSGDTAGVLIGAALNVISPVNFTTGTITLIDGVFAATSNTEAGYFAVQDTLLTDYSVATASNIDTTITATQKSDSVVASSLDLTTNEAAALRELVDSAAAASAASTDTQVLTDLQSAMVKNSGGSGQKAETKAILEQASVQTDITAGSISASRAMTGTVQSIVSNRMASLRSGDAYITGVSAGNGMTATSGFIQAFGSEVTQKNTTEGAAIVYGYTSDTSGVAIGFDGNTDTGETIGLSASYSSTDVKGKGTGKAENSIDSYTVSLYGDKATDFGYLEGSLTYGVNSNSASRKVNVSNLDRTYKSEYDQDQISLKIGVGKPTEVNSGAYVTTFGTVNASVVSTDTYTETSTTANDSMRLKVAQDDVTSIVGSIGVKGHWVTDKGTPMISLALNNEFGDTEINSTNNYTGGGTVFSTSTDVEEMSATLGLGYSFGNDTTSVDIGYEAEANDDDYLSHFGSVKIVAKF
jgi:uncharacterized protein with beta-barrel porin domain